MVWLTSVAWACPERPLLRDVDDDLVLLSQNLQFIVVGEARRARAALLDDYLDGEGGDVDLLLLAEARDVGALRSGLDGWCFYAQSGDPAAYAWAPAEERRPPGGLVLGVRQRDRGREKVIDEPAGSVFTSRPVSLAEGWLGRIAGFVKGWAEVRVDGTAFTWTHTQASYARSPVRGAGRPGVGRAGQFQELAGSLSVERPTLLTGDLNVLEGFHPADPGVEAKVAPARHIDTGTIEDFLARTRMAFFGHPSCDDGTFVGTVRTDEESDSPFRGARFDRVGANELFTTLHPETAIECTEIRRAQLRVSDHRGVRIAVPGL